MNISTNELYHFTSFENLKSIIQSKSFIPRFSIERTPLANNFRYKVLILPVAMVCFCDIPYELSDYHRKRYGNHGIVLTEKWKLSKGLNPVLYIQENSFLANVFSHFMGITDKFHRIIEDENYDLDLRIMLADIGYDLTNLSFFLKQFENKKSILNIDDKKQELEIRRFYDEREWRYIPIDAENKNQLFLPLQDYNNPEKLKIANDNLIQYKLSFEFNDLEYLIVENENEKQELEVLTQTIFNQKVKILIQ